MVLSRPLGKLILLNSASSTGKSTLCWAIQTQRDEPFLQFSLDFLMFGARVLPQRRDPDGPFAWAEMRPRLFEGYFRCLPAWLGAGNNLVVDFIIETPQQWRRLTEVLRPFDVFLVGVHCPPDELERRERQRGDRRPGEARRDLLTVHTFTRYDFEVDSTHSPENNAAAIIAAWQARQQSGALLRP